MTTFETITHHNVWDWGHSYTLIKHGGISMGTIKVCNDEPELAYITDITVNERYRSLGYGKEILESCIDKVKELKIQNIILTTIKDSIAYKMYLKHGFVYYGEKPNEDGYVPMYKKISN